MSNRAAARAFLLQYVGGDMEKARHLADRNRQVLKVDPADCDDPHCGGWHMEVRWDDGYPEPEGILVRDLLETTEA